MMKMLQVRSTSPLRLGILGDRVLGAGLLGNKGMGFGD